VATLAAGALLSEVARHPARATPCYFNRGGAQYRVVHTPRLQLGDAPWPRFPAARPTRWTSFGRRCPSGPERVTASRSNTGSPFRTGWLPATAHAPIDTGVGQRVIHSAAITGLRHDTNYEYRVRHWRAGMVINAYQHVFHTDYRGSDAPFTFAAYGDSAENWRVHNFRAVQRQINDSPAAFALTLGDNIYPAGLHRSRTPALIHC